MRKSFSTLVFFSVLLVLMVFSLVDAINRQHATAQLLEKRTELVKELGLSDLALFTEARFTRHLSLADRHSPFQDHPASLDHFPSTSLVLPPVHLHP